MTEREARSQNETHKINPKLRRELERCVLRSRHIAANYPGESTGNTAWLIEGTSIVRAAGSYDHCLSYMRPGRFIVTAESLGV